MALLDSCRGINPPEMLGFGGYGGKYMARKAGGFRYRYLGFRGISIIEDQEDAKFKHAEYFLDL